MKLGCFVIKIFFLLYKRLQLTQMFPITDKMSIIGGSGIGNVRYRTRPLMSVVGNMFPIPDPSITDILSVIGNTKARLFCS